MPPPFVINDFPAKIDLLFRSGKGGLSAVRALADKVQAVEPDYLQRVVAGTRPLSRRVFLEIVKAAEPAGLSQGDWHGSAANFAQKLGLSLPSPDADISIETPGGGLNFRSRNADPQNLRTLYAIIGGYWECFYYSASTFGRQRICHELMTIDAPNADGLMPCRIVDSSATYEGKCFPTHTSFVYLMLDKSLVHDEIAIYLLNRPDRAEIGELDGVVLGTTGGVEENSPVPCAARVTFRFLAKTQSELRRLYPAIQPDPGERFEDSVRRALFHPPFIDPDSIDPKDDRLMAVKRRIDNTVPPDQIPFALRMEHPRRTAIR